MATYLHIPCVHDAFPECPAGVAAGETGICKTSQENQANFLKGMRLH